MIYPDVSTDEWCKKHRLTMSNKICPTCGEQVSTVIPFITKDLVGLKSRHPCLKGRISVFTQRSAAKTVDWNQVYTALQASFDRENLSGKK